MPQSVIGIGVHSFPIFEEKTPMAAIPDHQYLSKELPGEILSLSPVKEFEEQTTLLKEGDYVKVVPVVLNGLVKAFTRTEERDLLLYYLRPGESCIMSFTACLRAEKSRIWAMTEEPTTLLLLPAEKIPGWVTTFPEINRLFYKQFDLRYSELISTINQLLYSKLDRRLLDYLKGKAGITGRNQVRISHREIASDLGTAREVVSRLLKKLEQEGRVSITGDGIRVL